MGDMIYKATYSSVPVYEMPCQGVAVMRRKSDAWLNATQILKVAGFDKPQRTRVLEREVQKGVHEKVQGGYGKYQGTWIPMELGIALSRQYGVDRLLQPIFDYVPTRDSPPPAPKHITAAPNRAPRKKADGTTSGGSTLDNAAAAKAAKAAAASAANAKRKEAASAAAAEIARRKAEEAAYDDEEGDYSMLPPSDGGHAASPTPSQASSTSQTPSPLGSEIGGETPNGTHRKRKHHEMGPPSSVQSQYGRGPLQYARMILDYFVSESTQVPQFLVTPPADFDANVVIDDDGHTALHWACAMGRIRIVKLLLTAGADIFRANSMGQTALMRSVMFTNNYDLRKFNDLFELLHRSTINIDRNDRTVFHYIVDIALQKGKTHAARYYIETVLDRLRDYPKEVADILNFQDEEGETALTLAARARSKRLVKILLDNGADPKIANRDGKTAEDYILEDERFRQQENSISIGGTPQTNFPTPHSSVVSPRDHMAAHQAAGSYVGKLYNSQTGTRASREIALQATELVDQLASSFDAELATQTRDLNQAQDTLAAFRAEIVDSQAQVQSLEAQAADIEQTEKREVELQNALANRMGQRFRLGWEKWIRDEDNREQRYDDDAHSPPEPDLDQLKLLLGLQDGEAGREAHAIKAKIDALKDQRETHFAEFVELRTAAGTGVKMQQYRQLIALGCGVPLDKVDEVMPALCDTLDGRDDGLA